MVQDAKKSGLSPTVAIATMINPNGMSPEAAAQMMNLALGLAPHRATPEIIGVKRDPVSEHIDADYDFQPS